jgi:hypothetical protein
MNKFYWIVCDDKDTNVFEGRYQGRTRGEAHWRQPKRNALVYNEIKASKSCFFP